jgi:serine/threonine protein phosphatase 1
MDAYIRESIPAAHVAFLRNLPIMDYTPDMVFVHAGIRPGIPLAEQDETDLTNIRAGFLDRTRELDRMVIHGHTPVAFPRTNGREVGIDTGVVDTGRLTGLRIIGKRGRLFFS